MKKFEPGQLWPAYAQDYAQALLQLESGNFLDAIDKFARVRGAVPLQSFYQSWAAVFMILALLSDGRAPSVELAVELAKSAPRGIWPAMIIATGDYFWVLS